MDKQKGWINAWRCNWGAWFFQHPRQWSKWINLAERWYNTTPHTAIKMNQFEAFYGIKLLQLALGQYQKIQIASVDDVLQERHKWTMCYKKTWLKLGQDETRCWQTKVCMRIHLGDWVYLKHYPYAQQSVANRVFKKLAAKYYGPYKVLQKLGKVAYKLELPPGAHSSPFSCISTEENDRRKTYPNSHTARASDSRYISIFWTLVTRLS